MSKGRILVVDDDRLVLATVTHGLTQADYEVIVPLELLQQAEQTKRIFNIVLGSIAAISLIVGGIGIMDIMLATVTERTREIGIRRALGAKKQDIITQFLVETVVLSVGGGLLGVAVGLSIPLHHGQEGWSVGANSWSSLPSTCWRWRWL